MLGSETIVVPTWVLRTVVGIIFFLWSMLAGVAGHVVGEWSTVEQIQPQLHAIEALSREVRAINARTQGMDGRLQRIEEWIDNQR